MTVRLTVQRSAWLDRVRSVADSMPGLVPVVKGNGYGFGRPALLRVAAELADTVCVGTIHELDSIPAGIRPVVLTPVVEAPAWLPEQAVLTVSSAADVDTLLGWSGHVLVKLRSTMNRFGAAAEDVDDVLRRCADASLTVVGTSLHLPLAGSEDERRAEIERWIDRLDPSRELWISHLDPQLYRALVDAHPRRRLRIRVGSALWHGAKDQLRLSAHVLATHPIAAGTPAGYRLTPAETNGTIVAVGAGSAHGVAPIVTTADHGSKRLLSPFHFGRQRMPLHEDPHMHTTMCLVPEGQPTPRRGEWVDLQRPLTHTNVDEIVWL